MLEQIIRNENKIDHVLSNVKENKDTAVIIKQNNKKQKVYFIQSMFYHRAHQK